MEFIKHGVKVMGNLALAVLAATIAPLAKNVIDGKTIPAIWGAYAACALLFYLLLELVSICLLYNFIDFPRAPGRGG
ncbi:hypothetical protein [Chromobacterium phragmitis]|uniref:Uncharacterized protein n=1 Tax=Chromobacterium phragmitis TaxID=2202141 RepID=A0ABV0INI7_9NEIS